MKRLVHIQICTLDEGEEEGIARRDEMRAQCNPLNGPYGGEKELRKKSAGDADSPSFGLSFAGPERKASR